MVTLYSACNTRTKLYMDWLGDRRDKMVSRVYKGIPDSMRGFAWKLLLDIDRKKEEQRGRYKVRQGKLNFIKLTVRPP